VSKSVNGIQERIKIVNSNKIPCKVNLKIENKEKEAVFSADVTQLTINAHEFAYVKIQFFPKNMQTYNGIFEANVVDGDGDIAHRTLRFNLKGQGT